MITATARQFARTHLGRSWVRALALALLIGGTNVVLSADPPTDPLAGKWSLTYHLTVKPGHETFAVPESPDTTVTRQVFVTHVCQPAFTVNPDGKFAFTADDTGCNRYEHEATSQGGAGTGVGKWQVYLKVSEGQVNANGNAVRLTLEQAFGSGFVTTEGGGIKVQTDVTTSPDSETLTAVVRTPAGNTTNQFARVPGGYTPFSKWGRQKWELKKTSQEGSTTIYSDSRDVQLGGGLLVVETVEVQRKTGPDLEVAFEGGGQGTFRVQSVAIDGLLDVNVLVTNVGEAPSEAAELTIRLRDNALIPELVDAGTGIGIGRRMESWPGSVSFRVGRLEPKPKPDYFTNATARFRLRIRPDLTAKQSEWLNEPKFTGYKWEGPQGLPSTMVTIHAEVRNSLDTNDDNNEDWVNILAATRKK